MKKPISLSVILLVAVSVYSQRVCIFTAQQAEKILTVVTDTSTTADFLSFLPGCYQLVDSGRSERVNSRKYWEFTDKDGIEVNITGSKTLTLIFALKDTALYNKYVSDFKLSGFSKDKERVYKYNDIRLVHYDNSANSRGPERIHCILITSIHSQDARWRF
jgi:hypothetical protein